MFGKISLLQASVLLVGLCASFTDIRFGKIYNKLTLPTAILGFAYSTFMFGLDGALQAVSGVLLGLLLYGWMFGLRILGGGDVKLLMAFGAWMGAHSVFEVAILGILLGGAFSAMLLIVSGRIVSFIKRMYHFLLTVFVAELEVEPPKIDKNLKMAFGIPISIAAVWVSWTHPLDQWMMESGLESLGLFSWK
jgi:Flp pilus assembly protein protease CpaA